VGEAEDPESAAPPGGEVVGREDRVGSFHRDDDPERRLARAIRRPLVEVPLERGKVTDEPYAARALELVVVGELCPRVGVAVLAGPGRRRRSRPRRLWKMVPNATAMPPRRMSEKPTVPVPRPFSISAGLELPSPVR
jgi:hypothetical protein